MGLTNKQRGRQIFAGGIEAAARTYAADGAINAGASHVGVLSKTGSAGAYTLAAPVRSGMELELLSTTAFAHVVTATGLLDNGTAVASKNTLTFAAFPGANAVLRSYNGKWNVISVAGVTVA